MSFRNRLTLFFVLIVVVPMVAVGVVLFRLIADNESGKADARLAARQEVAIGLAGEAQDEARRAARTIADDGAFAQALRADDEAAIRARAEALRLRDSAERVVVVRAGRTVADVGNTDAIFPATLDLTDKGGQGAGRLIVSTENAHRYARVVQRVSDLQTIVRNVGGPVLATTIPRVDVAKLPDPRGEAKIAGQDYDAANFAQPGFPGDRTRVTLLSSQAAESHIVRRNRLIAGAVLVGFLILAFTFAAIVLRSLQRQIDAFLQAARRLGSGDFATEVPIQGHDEFAALGEEFNKMSRQLAERLEELNTERGRLRESMRRIGETFAANLDREGLLEIVVKAAVDGVGAEGGRASVRPTAAGALEEVAGVGSVDGLEEAIQAAEAKVLETGGPSDATVDGVSAISHPLRRGDDLQGRVSGVVSVARRDRIFNSGERELFHYLAEQAAVSIENVGLHETVERQAVTDELTGLSNRRRFQEALGSEVERSRRFGQPVGLVLLDLDDFKQVNDTYGHQQGDLVLREVARVLRETSREIDEPARYGGEELAVVLPGTDLEGAYNLAERVRAGVADLVLPLLDGDGVLRVTASFGVATLPGSADDMRGLFAAADEALYRAKRAGKNRTERAEQSTLL
jgi:diguanylate cyclase (GGDEF)-like protein